MHRATVGEIWLATSIILTFPSSPVTRNASRIFGSLPPANVTSATDPDT